MIMSLKFYSLGRSLISVLIPIPLCRELRYQYHSVASYVKEKFRESFGNWHDHVTPLSGKFNTSIVSRATFEEQGYYQSKMYLLNKYWHKKKLKKIEDLEDYGS